MNKPCDMHVVPELDYRTAHADARERTRAGEQQRTCPKCKRFIWESLYYKKWLLGSKDKLPKAVEEFLKKINKEHLIALVDDNYACSKPNLHPDDVLRACLTHPDSPIRRLIDAAGIALDYHQWGENEDADIRMNTLEARLAALEPPQSTEHGHTEEE